MAESSTQAGTLLLRKCCTRATACAPTCTRLCSARLHCDLFCANTMQSLQRCIWCRPMADEFGSFAWNRCGPFGELDRGMPAFRKLDKQRSPFGECRASCLFGAFVVPCRGQTSDLTLVRRQQFRTEMRSRGRLIIWAASSSLQCRRRLARALEGKTGGQIVNGLSAI